MSRVITKIVSMLLLLVVVDSAMAQVAGVDRPEESALKLAFQNPEPWKGGKYSEERSFMSRLYLSTGYSSEIIYGTRSLTGVKSSGVGSFLAIGYHKSPIHSFEGALRYGLLPYAKWKLSRTGALYNERDCIKSVGVEFRYLFNLTAYALKREEPTRWELMGLFGLAARSQSGNMALGFTTALRGQYNLTPKFGLYVEPLFGYYGKSFDTNTINADGACYSMTITAGAALSLGVSDGYQKIGEGKNAYEKGAKRGSEGNPAFAIKTNGLYWAMCTPNVGFELPMGRAFSLSAEYLFPNFSRREFDFHYYAQMFSGELRYWFNHKSKLQGFYIGAGGMMGEYDLQIDGDGNRSKSFSAYSGVLGYVKPLGRSLSMEFGLGAGMMNTEYEHYESDKDCLVWTHNATLSTVNITKATIGIVWTPQLKRAR